MNILKLFLACPVCRKRHFTKNAALKCSRYWYEYCIDTALYFDNRDKRFVMNILRAQEQYLQKRFGISRHTIFYKGAFLNIIHVVIKLTDGQNDS